MHWLERVLYMRVEIKFSLFVEEMPPLLPSSMPGKADHSSVYLEAVVSKMVSVAHFSTPYQTELIGKMTENANNKILHYARDYKKEYLFIRGLNKIEI